MQASPDPASTGSWSSHRWRPGHGTGPEATAAPRPSLPQSGARGRFRPRERIPCFILLLLRRRGIPLSAQPVIEPVHSPLVDSEPVERDELDVSLPRVDVHLHRLTGLL